MDYNIIAKELLTSYSISAPGIQFIRHNENITFKITDGVNNKNYLLRIHKPSTEGLFGLQHTLEGINVVWRFIFTQFNIKTSNYFPVSSLYPIGL